VSVSIPFTSFRDAFVEACTLTIDARTELSELDAVAGDGDLGSTLALGFEQARLVAMDATSTDIGELLFSVGRTIATKAPSTMGTLLGSAFMRAGRALARVSELDTGGVTVLLRECTVSVAERGRASLGERTVLDPMSAAADAAEACAGGASAAFAAAAAAAVAAAEATADMEPRHGRAGWIGERARGRPDAGATAWAVFLTGLAGSVDAAMTTKGQRT
jgi:dihydroxyacetone kinase